MVNVTAYNITHIISNPNCHDGIGCLFKNINDVSQGWMFISVLITVFIIATFAMITKGTDTLKAFVASSFLMLFLTIIGYIYEMVSDKFLVTFIIAFAALAGISVYLRKNVY